MPAWRRAGPTAAANGSSADGRVGFAHRRLAIIDLSERGAQPMHSADGTLVITFNGEIYNYRELQGRARGQGRQLPHRVRHRGAAAALRRARRGDGRELRGMFAFAIWDAAQRQLFLARDPTASSRSTTPTTAGRSASPRRSRRCWRAARCRAIPSRPAGRLLSVRQRARAVHRCSAASAPLPAGAHCVVDAAGPRAPQRLLQCRRSLAAGAGARPSAGAAGDARRADPRRGARQRAPSSGRPTCRSARLPVGRHRFRRAARH